MSNNDYLAAADQRHLTPEIDMSSEQADQYADQSPDIERGAGSETSKSRSHGLLIVGAITAVVVLGLILLMGALANQDNGRRSRDGFCDQLAANGQSC